MLEQMTKSFQKVFSCEQIRFLSGNSRKHTFYLLIMIKQQNFPFFFFSAEEFVLSQQYRALKWLLSKKAGFACLAAAIFSLV